jgi:antirestriction protein ArdC
MSSYENLRTFLQPINDEIVAALESENWGKWVKEWISSPDFLTPINLTTGKTYRGSNLYIAAYWQHKRNYIHNVWATAKQLKALGYYIKEEGKGKSIAMFAPQSTKVEVDGEIRTKFFGVKAFTVWNINLEYVGDDTKNPLPKDFIPIAERLAQITQPVASDFKELQKPSDLILAYLHNENIDTGLGDPSYSPTLDKIRMPEPKAFTSAISYYGTYLHEVGHSTGHPNRLHRFEMASSKHTEEYAREELVAELTAIYLCASLGLQYELENHISYLASWARNLKRDVSYFVRASNDAQKAAEYVLARSTVPYTTDSAHVTEYQPVY